jgi:hypothetical protein
VVLRLENVQRPDCESESENVHCMQQGAFLPKEGSPFVELVKDLRKDLREY